MTDKKHTSPAPGMRELKHSLPQNTGYIYNKELAQQFIDMLNELLELDGIAINRLFKQRVLCNKGLTNHPTVQVRREPNTLMYSLSVLGLLNGLVGIQEDGWGYIAAVYEVWCPYCGEVRDGTIHDKCGDCDTQLELGDLIRFELVDHS